MAIPFDQNADGRYPHPQHGAAVPGCQNRVECHGNQGGQLYRSDKSCGSGAPGIALLRQARKLTDGPVTNPKSTAGTETPTQSSRPGHPRETVVPCRHRHRSARPTEWGDNQFRRPPTTSPHTTYYQRKVAGRNKQGRRLPQPGTSRRRGAKGGDAAGTENQRAIWASDHFRRSRMVPLCQRQHSRAESRDNHGRRLHHAGIKPGTRDSMTSPAGHVG